MGWVGSGHTKMDPWTTLCQGRLNQWAHWARAQGPRIFFYFEGPPTGCGEINFFRLTILFPEDCTVREKLLNTGCFRRLEHLPSHVILFAFNFVRCPCSRSDIMPP